MRKTWLATVAGCALVTAGPALADSLTPATFSATIGVGGSTSITDKVGVITAGTPTSALADVLFVTDTTGSMGPAISTIQSNFSSIVSSLSSLGTISTGAAQYKDKTSDGYDPFDYNLDANISSNPANTQAAINSWSASGGGDNPEQGLYALQQAATTTAWTAGAKKIIVITGDAPSHSSPSYGPAAGGVSVSSVASTLESDGVTLLALNAAGLGGDTDNGLNAYGQFTGLLSDGVTGTYYNTNTSATTLTADIIAAIGSAFASYDDVSLDLVGPAPTCVSVTLPSDITGSFTRATTNTFDFGAVGITGTHAGTCSFTIALEADGGILAEETDTITVGAVPEPASLAVLGMGLLGLAGARRRRRT